MHFLQCISYFAPDRILLFGFVSQAYFTISGRKKQAFLKEINANHETVAFFIDLGYNMINQIRR